MVRAGEIYYANLPTNNGSVQSGKRPVVIVSNNKGNKFAPTVNIVPLTSKTKKQQPTHCMIRATEQNGLLRNSTALSEQITTISKSDLLQKLGEVSASDMNCIRRTIMVATGEDDLLQYDINSNVDIQTIKLLMRYMFAVLNTQKVA